MPRQSSAAKPAVMADVARLAGVSHQTVSRVINGSANLRPETRLRVLDAITRLNYRPNTAARALVSGHTGMIGVVGISQEHFGPSMTKKTVESSAQSAGLVALSITVPVATQELIEAAVEHLLRQRVEGIIAVAGHDSALDAARQSAHPLPVVVVEADLSAGPWSVGVDQFAGARIATEHLLGLGHTEIVHVSGPLGWTEARARVDGWRAAMHAANIRPAAPIRGDWSLESGYQAGLEIARNDLATAVFAANDLMAIGLLRALHENGRVVPDDISVVGFDDTPEAAYLIPPLSTIRQDFAAVGRMAVTLLQSAMAGDAPWAPSLIMPNLIVRQSAAHVRA